MADLELEEIKNASLDQLIDIMRKASHEDPRYDNKQRAIRDAARAQLDSLLYKSLTEATTALANHTKELAGSTAQIHGAATQISEAQGRLVEATNTLDTTVGGASRSSGRTAIAGLIVSALIALASIASLYYQSLRESHDLRAAVTELRFASGVLEAQVLLQNLGNQSEALLAAEFGYAKAPAELIEFSFGDSARRGGDLSEPHVIQPGDSLVVSMREKLDPKMFSTHLPPDAQSATFLVFVRFFSSRSGDKGFDSIAHCGSIDVSKEVISPAAWNRCNLELEGPGV